MTSMRFLLLLFFLVLFAAFAADETTENGHEQKPEENVQQHSSSLSSSSLRGGGGVTAEGTSGGLEQAQERELSQSSWSSGSSSSSTTSSSWSSGGGGGTSSTSWTSARPRRCPTLKCADPCPAGTCRSDQKCLTKPSYFFPHGAGGIRCPGCPVFRRCSRKTSVAPPPAPQPQPAPVPTNVIGICPVPPCQLPCGLCTMGEECQTKPTYFTGPNGQKCPGCPAFVGCVPIPSPPQQCGKVTCSSGTVCCNASCSICTPPDFACIQLACVDGEGQQCGKVTCPLGQVCCNASCGTCTPPDGACTQQLCGPPY